MAAACPRYEREGDLLIWVGKKEAKDVAWLEERRLEASTKLGMCEFDWRLVAQEALPRDGPISLLVCESVKRSASLYENLFKSYGLEHPFQSTHLFLAELPI